jgi:hypothetical protein
VAESWLEGVLGGTGVPDFRGGPSTPGKSARTGWRLGNGPVDWLNGARAGALTRSADGAATSYGRRAARPADFHWNQVIPSFHVSTRVDCPRRPSQRSTPRSGYLDVAAPANVPTVNS